MKSTPSSNPDAPPPDSAEVTYYYFEGPPGYDATARYAVSENQLSTSAFHPYRGTNFRIKSIPLNLKNSQFHCKVSLFIHFLSVWVG